MSMAPAYPFAIEVDPPAPQSRLTVFFRIILAIPHAIIVQVLGVAAAVMTLIAWVAILATGKYPAGLYSFVLNVNHWQLRLNGYIFLLAGTYPPFAMGPAEYPVRLTGEGELENRNRLTTLLRIIWLIPHIIILYFVQIAFAVVWVISWFAALFTGSVPAGMHNFMGGVLRWQTRVGVYAMLLTDEYPPFSLN